MHKQYPAWARCPLVLCACADRSGCRGHTPWQSKQLLLSVQWQRSRSALQFWLILSLVVRLVHSNRVHPRRVSMSSCNVTDYNKKKWPSVYSNMRPCVAVLEIAAQMAGLWGLNFRIIYVRSINNLVNSHKTSFMPRFSPNERRL